MSILLAIIALNLFSIARSLNTEAKLNEMKLDCARWNANEKVDLYKKYLIKYTTNDSWCNSL